MKPTVWPLARSAVTARAFLVRGKLGEHVGGLGRPGQLRVAHAGHVQPQQHVPYLQAHLPADGAGDLFVVAGEDLGGDAMFLQCPQGGGGGFLGRIQKSKIAHEHHVPLVLHPEGARRGGAALLGNGQHPKALVVHLVHVLEDAPAQLLGQRLQMESISSTAAAKR